MATEKVYSYLQMEAMLCVWEFLNDEHERLYKPLPAEKKLHTFEGDLGVPLIDYWTDVGTVEMRLTETPKIADWLLAVFDAGKTLDEDYWDMWSYDWEVVPGICREIDWAKARIASEPLLPTEPPLEIAKRVHAKMIVAMGWNTWHGSAVFEGRKQWCYHDFVDDNPEAARAAFEAGEPAEDYIKREGERLGLTAREGWGW